VNFDDLLLLAQNYGHPLPADAPTTELAAVAAASNELLLMRKLRRRSR
jgi:hypothetical protein